MSVDDCVERTESPAEQAVVTCDDHNDVRRPAARVVLAVPESDAHVVANRLLEYFLKQRGHTVLNLGACTPAAEIAAAARDFAADAIIISSQNGHALDDLGSLPAEMVAVGVAGVPVYLGGNLNVGAEKRLDDVAARFRPLGIRIAGSFDDVDELLRLPAARIDDADSTPACAGLTDDCDGNRTHLLAVVSAERCRRVGKPVDAP